MALPIGIANPFRYPSELEALVVAAQRAGSEDESQWIEWKTDLDLSTKSAEHHLSKQILDFANREPSVASKWAGGHAYILVGVEPGNLVVSEKLTIRSLAVD